MRLLHRMLEKGAAWWVNTVQPPNVPQDPVNVELIAAINAERTSRGLSLLTADRVLTDGAQRWAEAMARVGQMTHGDFSNRINAEYPNTWAAEDIAEGPDVKTVVAMWMADRPHREAILGNFTIVGGGFSTAADGTLYWCIDFDRPMTLSKNYKIIRWG